MHQISLICCVCQHFLLGKNGPKKRLGKELRGPVMGWRMSDFSNIAFKYIVNQKTIKVTHSKENK